MKIEEACGLDSTRARMQMKAWQKRLRDFTEVTGNQREYEREKVFIVKSINDRSKSIYEEYIKNETHPNVGKVVLDHNQSENEMKSEKSVANILVKELGGTIYVKKSFWRLSVKN